MNFVQEGKGYCNNEEEEEEEVMIRETTIRPMVWHL